MHLEQENHTPHQDQIDQEVQDYVWDHSYFMKRPPAQCRNILLDPISLFCRETWVFFTKMHMQSFKKHENWATSPLNATYLCCAATQHSGLEYLKLFKTVHTSKHRYTFVFVGNKMIIFEHFLWFLTRVRRHPLSNATRSWAKQYRKNLLTSQNILEANHS